MGGLALGSDAALFLGDKDPRAFLGDGLGLAAGVLGRERPGDGGVGLAAGLLAVGDGRLLTLDRVVAVGESLLAQLQGTGGVLLGLTGGAFGGALGGLGAQLRLISLGGAAMAACSICASRSSSARRGPSIGCSPASSALRSVRNAATSSPSPARSRAPRSRLSSSRQLAPGSSAESGQNRKGRPPWGFLGSGRSQLCSAVSTRATPIRSSYS
ncbi:hypothetical protein [Micromonospora haikouensis]|uniref:hypothetical protein n=1 Tax=Micromonospora haikouensis TaxID=686309 RepID=UPI003D70FF15